MEAYLEICFGSWTKFIRRDYSFATKTDSMDTVLAFFYLFMSGTVPLILLIGLSYY
jgi:hypothetical protein